MMIRIQQGHIPHYKYRSQQQKVSSPQNSTLHTIPFMCDNEIQKIYQKSAWSIHNTTEVEEIQSTYSSIGHYEKFQGTKCIMK